MCLHKISVIEFVRGEENRFVGVQEAQDQKDYEGWIVSDHEKWMDKTTGNQSFSETRRYWTE